MLTSATLRTAGYGGTESTFNYLRERLHAHEADELAVGSPFDYKNSTLLYLVTDIPEPNQPGYQRLLEQAIIDTAVTLGGRTLVLFTANNHLNQTATAIDSQLARHNITTPVSYTHLDVYKRQDCRRPRRRRSTRRGQ